MPIQQTKPKPKPIAMIATTLPLTISFVGGSKGGVGKSFCCRGLYEYHLARRLQIVGFEADLRTPDFAGIYTEIKTAGHCVHFSEDEH
jgi:MinD superfamily P-loop ATPase